MNMYFTCMCCVWPSPLWVSACYLTQLLNYCCVGYNYILVEIINIKTPKCISSHSSHLISSHLILSCSLRCHLSVPMELHQRISCLRTLRNRYPTLSMPRLQGFRKWYSTARRSCIRLKNTTHLPSEYWMLLKQLYIIGNIFMQAPVSSIVAIKQKSHSNMV